MSLKKAIHCVLATEFAAMVEISECALGGVAVATPETGMAEEAVAFARVEGTMARVLKSTSDAGEINCWVNEGENGSWAKTFCASVVWDSVCASCSFWLCLCAARSAFRSRV